MGTNIPVNLGNLKNLKWWQATIMITVILLAAGFAAREGANLNVSVNVNLETRVEAIENVIDIPVNSSLSAFRKTNSYIISPIDAYATLLAGSNAHLIEFLTNHSEVIMDGLANASVSGGSVYISEGLYSANVTLKNNTRLIIDEGATGIAVTGVDASANCILDDFNSGVFQYYKSGLLYTSFDYAHGIIWWNGQNKTDIIANPTRYGKYVTYGDGINYQIQNCTSGQTIYRSTNGSNTINFALGNLTTGRNWKEPVIVLGNYTVDASINVPAYSQPLLYCYMMKAAYNNNSMFVLNGVNDIEIDGGILDGNRANQNIPGVNNALLQEISITNCQRVTVHGVTGLNSGNMFIYLYGSYDCIITHNYSNNTYNDGIHLNAGCYSNTVSENNLWYCGHVPIVMYSAHDNTITANVGAYYGQRVTFAGIYVFQDSYRNTFTANVMEYGVGSGGHGISINGPGASWGNILQGNTCINNTSAYGIFICDANDNTVSGNTCANNSKGIVLGTNTVGSFYNTVRGNEVCGNTGDGIFISASGNNTISGNSVHNNGRYGFYAVTAPNMLNWIEGNDIEGNVNSGIRLEPANMTLIKNNKIVANGGYGIVIAYASSGNNTIWLNDIGWNTSGDISNVGTNTIAFDNWELATRTWVASINPPTGGR
jgi:parallel beta-helix repeat protein